MLALLNLVSVSNFMEISELVIRGDRSTHIKNLYILLKPVRKSEEVYSS
jgi:hypothetical protein